MRVYVIIPDQRSYNSCDPSAAAALGDLPTTNAFGSALAALKRWTGIDRAIGFTLLARSWSALAGVLTVLLVAHYLSPTEQGYYYSFFAIASLQVVFDLGFSMVALQVAAHERSRLTVSSSGDVEGDAAARSRLSSMFQTIVRWYSCAAITMLSTLAPAGFVFFGAHDGAGAVVAWKIPWLALVFATALGLALNPVLAFIEGCGFVGHIARMRFAQAIVGSTMAWAALVAGHGLFSPALLILGQAMVQLFYLFTAPARVLAKNLLLYAVDRRVSWKTEVWPFQWRLAVTSLSAYLVAQFITPVMFSVAGPVVAGRMGMSLSIASAVGTFGLAWISTKASPFGALIARGEIPLLDRLFFRALWQSTALVAVMAAAVFAAYLVAVRSFPPLTLRLLPCWAFLLLLLTAVMNHILASQAIYLRAHKREPLIVTAMAVAVALGITTPLLGHFYGANAVILAYFLLGGVMNFSWSTYVFVTARRQWHSL